MSKIEWTDETWNPIAGCSKVSPGCTNCYAEKMAGRLELMGQTKYAGLIVLQGSHRVWTGKIAFDEHALLAPLQRKKPTRYFVNSMSDLFHENVTDEMIDRVFAVMALCPQHTFQVLTKRPERMLRYLRDSTGLYGRVLNAANPIRHKYPKLCGIPISDPARFPLPNVWVGVSVENQGTADARIPLLLRTPAAMRFISAEPLLGPVDLTLDGIACDPCSRCADGSRVEHETNANGCRRCDGTGKSNQIALDWVIVGGESGPRARPMHPDWARSLRDQCEAAGVAFFFKQWGEWVPWQPDVGFSEWKSQAGKLVDRHAFPDFKEGGVRWCTDACGSDGDDICAHQRVGKKAAGALLDGREWRQMPGEAR